MAKLLTRAENIKNARKMKKQYSLFLGFQNLILNAKGKSLRKEQIFETEFGRVRTLMYGFDNTKKNQRSLIFTVADLFLEKPKWMRK